MTGTADSLADLLMREPLRRQAGLTLDPATVKGQAEGDLVLALKLGKTARPEDTQFHASGALDNLQIEKFLADEKLESATATFEADRDSLKIAGDGQVLGTPTHVEVARAPGEEGSATITFALDAAGRARRGINLGSWLTGVAPHQAQGAPHARQCGGRNRPYACRRRQPRPGTLEAGGKAGQGDVPRQAQSGRRFAQQHRHRPRRAGVPGIGSDGLRRRRGERHDDAGAHRGRRRFQGRRCQWRGFA